METFVKSVSLKLTEEHYELLQILIASSGKKQTEILRSALSLGMEQLQKQKSFEVKNMEYSGE